MGDEMTGRARRLRPAAETGTEDGLAEPDYASSFAVDVPDADTRSPEDWARSTLEGAPRVLRWFVLIGWKAVLRLRLEPLHAAGNVLGWRIRSTAPDAITLEVSSSLVAARKVLRVEPDRLILTTLVWFKSVRGRIVWSVIAPVHHRIEPTLLTLATRARRPRRR
jgi:hypothetical protein